MRFDADRGYGFIAPDSGGKDLFMHISALRGIDHRTIKPNMRVSYQEDDSGRGPKAVNVVGISDSEVQEPDGEPAQPTEAAWRALWSRVSTAAFNELLAEAHANGWVQP